MESVRMRRRQDLRPRLKASTETSSGFGVFRGLKYASFGGTTVILYAAQRLIFSFVCDLSSTESSVSYNLRQKDNRCSPKYINAFGLTRQV